MSVWRRTRNEVAGAWRSLRYDLDRRTDGPVPDEPVPVGPVPDVTSTGMSTFGGPVAEELSIGYDEELPRRPRRMLAVSAFALLTVVGAGGSYFAVVNGLSSLLTQQRPAAEAHPYPLAAEAPPATSADAGIGRPARPAGGQEQHPAVAAPAVVPPSTTAAVAPAAAVARPRHTTAERGEQPGPSGCHCVTPPVPTPTAPSEPPTATPSATPSPSASSPDDAPASPSPSGSASAEAFRRSGRPRGY